MNVYNDPRVDKIIRQLPGKESARIIQLIDLFKEFGFSLPELYLKKLTQGLWELRAGRWRLLFGGTDNNYIIVNIFMKKTQKTPKKELETALQRLKQYI